MIIIIIMIIFIIIMIITIIIIIIVVVVITTTIIIIIIIVIVFIIIIIIITTIIIIVIISFLDNCKRYSTNLKNIVILSVYEHVSQRLLGFGKVYGPSYLPCEAAKIKKDYFIKVAAYLRGSK